MDRSQRSEGVGSSSLDMFQIFLWVFEFFEQKYFFDLRGEGGRIGEGVAKI